MTIYSLAVWAFKNKKGNAFKDWTFEQVLFGIHWAVSNNKLIYASDGNGSYCGVMVLNDQNHIVSTIATTKGTLKKMATLLKKQHGTNFTATRHGKPKTYDINRVLTHLH